MDHAAAPRIGMRKMSPWNRRFITIPRVVAPKNPSIAHIMYRSHAGHPVLVSPVSPALTIEEAASTMAADETATTGHIRFITNH